MPQVVPPGGHTAGGIKPIVGAIFTLLVAREICVEATAPVTTRERAKRRAISFMIRPFWYIFWSIYKLALAELMS